MDFLPSFLAPKKRGRKVTAQQGLAEKPQRESKRGREREKFSGVKYLWVKYVSFHVRIMVRMNTFIHIKVFVWPKNKTKPGVLFVIRST